MNDYPLDYASCFITLVEHGNQSLLLEKISLSVFQNARLWQICQKAPFGAHL